MLETLAMLSIQLDRCIALGCSDIHRVAASVADNKSCPRVVARFKNHTAPPPRPRDRYSHIGRDATQYVMGGCLG